MRDGRAGRPARPAGVLVGARGGDVLEALLLGVDGYMAAPTLTWDAVMCGPLSGSDSRGAMLPTIAASPIHARGDRFEIVDVSRLENAHYGNAPKYGSALPGLRAGPGPGC